MWDGVEWREMCRSKLADSEALPTSFITALLGLYVPGRRGCLSPTPIKIVNLSAPVHQFGSTGLQICVAELTEGFNFLGGGGGRCYHLILGKVRYSFGVSTSLAALATLAFTRCTG